MALWNRLGQKVYFILDGLLCCATCSGVCAARSLLCHTGAMALQALLGGCSRTAAAHQGMAGHRTGIRAWEVRESLVRKNLTKKIQQLQWEKLQQSESTCMCIPTSCSSLLPQLLVHSWWKLLQVPQATQLQVVELKSNRFARPKWHGRSFVWVIDQVKSHLRIWHNENNPLKWSVLSEVCRY